MCERGCQQGIDPPHDINLPINAHLLLGWLVLAAAIYAIPVVHSSCGLVGGLSEGVICRGE